MKMLHFPEFHGLDAVARSHLSVARMFFLYVLPLSILPPAMLYFAGVSYSNEWQFALSRAQLETIGLVFFLTEVAMVFIMAVVIQRLGEVIDFRPSFEDSFKLAAVAPTPLWIAPLFLFIPSFLVNMSVAALALVAAGALVVYAAPGILKIEEKGHALLMSGWICAAGMVAWAVMMYLTLLTWNAVTSSLPI